MNQYQMILSGPPVMTVGTVQIVGSNTFIPLHQDNRDCVRFLSDWKAGAEVKNPDGTLAPYSDEAVTALGLTPPTGTRAI
jgi:hypothetical protein